VRHLRASIRLWRPDSRSVRRIVRGPQRGDAPTRADVISHRSLAIRSVPSLRNSWAPCRSHRCARRRICMKTLLLWPRRNRPTDSLCAVARIPQSVSSIVEIPPWGRPPGTRACGLQCPRLRRNLGVRQKDGCDSYSYFHRLRFAVGRSGSVIRIQMATAIRSTSGELSMRWRPAWLDHAVGIDKCEQFRLGHQRAASARRVWPRVGLALQPDAFNL
jgi:hypothetical protein